MNGSQSNTGERSSTTSTLVVEELTCELETPNGRIRPVDNVSFELGRAKTLSIVGESGSGKSMLVRAIMGLTPPGIRVAGRVLFNGTDLLSLNRNQLQAHLGSGIGMIFQNPMTSLNPVVPIGRQITEGMRAHLGISGKDAKERAIDLLRQVGISQPAARLKQYPHELSGGLRQRVTIAAALGCDPEVLIADEATTALDVTVQKQILDLLQEIQAQRHMSLIIISHDLGVVAGRSDDVAVMYVGQVVEMGPTRAVFKNYKHRYTAALLESIPSLDHEPHAELATIAGSLPPLAALPPGCRFAPRCGAATAECSANIPPVTHHEDPAHWYRCYWPVDDPVEIRTSGVRSDDTP